jgi:adenylosuccinate lyase
MNSRARHEEYCSPFSARYASPEMSRLFPPHYKAVTFRRLWVALAKAQKKLGLPITSEQVSELENHIDTIDFDAIRDHEKVTRHDVMAHILALGDQCPRSKPIIHLGATSTYVTDNGDLIQLKEALTLLFSKWIHLLRSLRHLADQEAASPCLAYTHFQPAQPTTIGKRIALWLQDLFLDAQALEQQLATLPFLGVKGATGTQASFLALFDGQGAKVKELETLIAASFGFTKILPIAGQTYTRKLDLTLLNLLASFAASAHKMATDIRLLAHEGEITEGQIKTQVGSSAMPYKRNPIYSERICGLARFVISLAQNPAYTAATQWLERTLDDSSNRRLSIPEALLGTDAICHLLSHLLTHLHIDRKASLTHLEAQLPHLAMENLLMLAVKKGADRQATHELLRQSTGKTLSEMAQLLHLDLKELKLAPSDLVGLAPTQVHDFLKQDLDPFLHRHKHLTVTMNDVEI